MQAQYEAPELTLIGGAQEVVLGFGIGGQDSEFLEAGLDFEFEED